MSINGRSPIDFFERQEKVASRDIFIPPDLMPQKVEVKKSTVKLLVDGKVWQ